MLLPAGLLAGCRGDDPKPATGPGLPSQADLKSFFTAIASTDQDALSEAGSEIAADGSPAQDYVDYVTEFSAAAAAVGTRTDIGDVTEVDNGFKACADPDHCVTWSDLQGKGGRLTDFTVNDVKLDDSLVDLTGQAPVESTGLYKVQPDWAYRLPLSGTLIVLVTVTASDAALTPEPGLYIEQDQILKGAKKPRPPTVAAGSSGPVELVFPDAKDAQLDGQITFQLGIEGAGAESIGFGLTDPAA